MSRRRTSDRPGDLGESVPGDSTAFLLEGRARRLGDRVNTDYIIASRRKKETLDPRELKRWLLEGIDEGFAASVEPGDILVAGEAFGCGSAMEVAVTVVKAAGIPAVLASSFARTYFRNAVNNGLLPVECDTSGIREGDWVVVEVSRHGVAVGVRGEGTPGGGSGEGAGRRDPDGAQGSLDHLRVSRPFPPFLLDILAAGGLAPYLRARGRFDVAEPTDTGSAP